jgi:hypothetical protein
MLPLDRRVSFDVEFHQVAIAVAQLLARKMDDTFLFLIDGLAADDRGPAHRAAETANRIVVLCRRLVDEIRHHEDWERRRREEENEEGDEENDQPF